MEIQDYFKHEVDQTKRKKKYNELLLIYHPDKRRGEGNKKIFDNIFQFLQTNKVKLLELSFPDFVAKVNKKSKFVCDKYEPITEQVNIHL